MSSPARSIEKGVVEQGIVQIVLFPHGNLNRLTPFRCTTFETTFCSFPLSDPRVPPPLDHSAPQPQPPRGELGRCHRLKTQRLGLRPLRHRLQRSWGRRWRRGCEIWRLAPRQQAAAVHIYIYIYIYTHVCIHIHIYIYIYVCICIWTYISLSLYIYIWTYIYIYIYVYSHIHIIHASHPIRITRRRFRGRADLALFFLRGGHLPAQEFPAAGPRTLLYYHYYYWFICIIVTIGLLHLVYLYYHYYYYYYGFILYIIYSESHNRRNACVWNWVCSQLPNFQSQTNGSRL